jgi:hypothetical protein
MAEADLDLAIFLTLKHGYGGEPKYIPQPSNTLRHRFVNLVPVLLFCSISEGLNRQIGLKIGLPKAEELTFMYAFPSRVDLLFCFWT